MRFDDLTPDQMEKARNCKTAEELLELAKAEGYELSSEELDAIAGGTEWWEECVGPNGYSQCKCNYYQVINP